MRGKDAIGRHALNDANNFWSASAFRTSPARREEHLLPRTTSQEHSMVRKSFVASVFAALVGLCGVSVQAQVFPSRPVTWLVPYPAGGTSDAGARALASATEKHLGQRIVIENRPGVSGSLAAAQMAATAQPDGYTIALTPGSIFRLPHIFKTAYDPRRDFTYIIGVSGFSYGVVVKADAPWQTFVEFLADAQAHPGKISYGTSGANSIMHITMMLIAKSRGIDWVHVPFRGTPDEVSGVLGGHVHAVADASGWAPQVNAGQLRLLVTWGSARAKSWPTVPTLREVGINLVVTAPYGFAGPRGMDPKVTKALHDAMKKGMEEPTFVSTLKLLEQEPAYLSSEEYRDYAMREFEEQRRIVTELGLKE
jgi:tripartite-type tricarboxylate transporter receptor subunit TctC